MARTAWRFALALLSIHVQAQQPFRPFDHRQQLSPELNSGYNALAGLVYSGAQVQGVAIGARNAYFDQRILALLENIEVAKGNSLFPDYMSCGFDAQLKQFAAAT